MSKSRIRMRQWLKSSLDENPYLTKHPSTKVSHLKCKTHLDELKHFKTF